MDYTQFSHQSWDSADEETEAKIRDESLDPNHMISKCKSVIWL